MNMTPASLAHAAAIAAIHAAAAAAGAGEHWSEASMRSLLVLPTTLGLVGADGGFILLRCAADEAEILMLAVVPPKRRRGIARTLLQSGLEAAMARGAVTAFLEVAVTNAPARALYDAEGFREIGRRRGYYANGADAVVLRKPLQDGDPSHNISL
jgi:ribosomal-protein-alanine N-acetyltransferase